MIRYLRGAVEGGSQRGQRLQDRAVVVALDSCSPEDDGRKNKWELETDYFFINFLNELP